MRVARPVLRGRVWTHTSLSRPTARRTTFRHGVFTVRRDPSQAHVGRHTDPICRLGALSKQADKERKRAPEGTDRYVVVTLAKQPPQRANVAYEWPIE